MTIGGSGVGQGWIEDGSGAGQGWVWGDCQGVTGYTYFERVKVLV